MRVPIQYVTHTLEDSDAIAQHLTLPGAGHVIAAGPVDALDAHTIRPPVAYPAAAGGRRGADG